MIEIPAAEIKGATYTDITLTIPETHRETWAVLAQWLHERGAHQLYIRIGKPQKPRSTGKHSQNHRIWGHARYIGKHVGESERKIYNDAIDIVVGKNPDIAVPYECDDTSVYVDWRGQLQAQHESRWTSRFAKAVCDALERIAQAVGIEKLPEYENDETGKNS